MWMTPSTRWSLENVNQQAHLCGYLCSSSTNKYTADVQTDGHPPGLSRLIAWPAWAHWTLWWTYGLCNLNHWFLSNHILLDIEETFDGSNRVLVSGTTCCINQTISVLTASLSLNLSMLLRFAIDSALFGERSQPFCVVNAGCSPSLLDTKILSTAILSCLPLYEPVSVLYWMPGLEVLWR